MVCLHVCILGFLFVLVLGHGHDSASWVLNCGVGPREYPRDDAKWNYDMIKIIQLGNKSDIDGHATVDELIQAL